MISKHTARRKPINSCLRCRSKKQKCDHGRPQCYQCRLRKTDCIYLNDHITAESKSQNQANYDRDLESECGNRIKDARKIIQKGDRWIVSGVTSMHVMKQLHSDNKFNKYFTLAWKKLRKERQIWKSKNNYSSLQEWTILDDHVINGKTMIEAVCKVLPSYQETRSHLKKYFEGARHKNFPILDPEKVMQDFEYCFMKGKSIDATSFHEVANLVPTKTNNYHSLGVIIEVMRTTYFTDIPKELEIFSGYLTSAASIKSLTIEKLQCVMLKLLHLDFIAMTRGDFSRGNMLIQMACSLATSLGFDSDLEIPTSGNKKRYIVNLWRWVLYMDVQLSFNLGIPLQIKKLSYHNFMSSSVNGDRNESLFIKTISVLRNVMFNIYDKDTDPDITELKDEIKRLIQHEFRPLAWYLAPKNYNHDEFLEVHALLFLLTTITTLSGVQKYYFHDRSAETYNTMIQLSFTVLYITITVLKTYHELDKQYGAYYTNSSSKKIPDHLQMGVWMTYQTFGRATYDIYGLLFSTLQGSVHKSPQTNEINVCDYTVGSLEVNNQYIVSIKPISEMLNSIFDMLYSRDCKELLQLLKRSYCFLLLLSLEKISRRILENGLIAKGTDEYALRNLDNNEAHHENNTIPVIDSVDPLPFWDQCDTFIANWLDDDFEASFSKWFQNS